MVKSVFAVLAVLAVAGFAGAANAASDTADGERLFKKCKGCHTIGDGAKNRVGPLLTGIADNEIASVEGYKYSKAFLARKAEGLVWTAEELDAFLTKPKDFIPKTKMSYRGMKDAEDRAKLIDYLMSFE